MRRLCKIGRKWCPWHWIIVNTYLLNNCLPVYIRYSARALWNGCLQGHTRTCRHTNKHKDTPAYTSYQPLERTPHALSKLCKPFTHNIRASLSLCPGFNAWRASVGEYTIQRKSLPEVRYSLAKFTLDIRYDKQKSFEFDNKRRFCFRKKFQAVPRIPAI